jgi:hypothetical protein
MSEIVDTKASTHVVMTSEAANAVHSIHTIIWFGLLGAFDIEDVEFKIGEISATNLHISIKKICISDIDYNVYNVFTVTYNDVIFEIICVTNNRKYFLFRTQEDFDNWVKTHMPSDNLENADPENV